MGDLIPDPIAQQRAQFAVAQAIREGRLGRPAVCSRGDHPSRRVHAHHPDYSRPLEVEWLCPHHHRLEHAGETGRLRERMLVPAGMETVGEAAERIRRSLSFVRSLIARGLLRAWEVHGVRETLIRTEDLDKVLKPRPRPTRDDDTES